MWLNFSDFELTDSQIEDKILNKAKVWLDRGTMFGIEGEKFQRINCATPRKILEAALKAICGEFKNN